jgi:hypothetical protein
VVHAHRIGLGNIAEDAITLDGPFQELQTAVEPAREDWAIRLMNRLSRSPFLTKHLLLNDGVFYPVRRAVNLFRSLLRRGPRPEPATR